MNISVARPAMVAFISLASISSQDRASADNYADCVAGYQRYQNNVATLQETTTGTTDRSTSCRAIAPEEGYAACEKFIRSGIGTPEQVNWAQSVSKQMAAVYKKCQAQ